MNAVIGIDIGSSGIKAVLYAPATGAVLHHARLQTDARVQTAQPGHFEEDPVAIRDATYQLIRDVNHIAEEMSRRVEAIAFTGQMHGGLIVNDTLDPLTNFITWQDKRGDETTLSGKTFVEGLREQAPEDSTGTGIHTGFLLTSLYWLSRNGGFPPKAAHVLGIYDWITSLFVGRAVTDISSASAWAMLDPISTQWKEDLIRFADVPFEWLPEVVEPGENLGVIDSTISRELGLPKDVRVHASIGDTQASYLGSGCKRNEVLLNFGTGSQSLWETTLPLATEGTDIRYLNQNSWLVTASTLAGGEAYRILADFFRDTVREFSGQEMTLDQTYEMMNRLAYSVAAHGISFDPIFAGSKFGGHGNDRASISGLTAANFLPSQLTRALLDGMIEEVARPYVLRMGQHYHAGIVGAGNAIRHNAALRKAAETRFGLPLRLSPYPEEASIGAALLASVR